MLSCSPRVAAWPWEWLTDISRHSSRPRCSECDTYPNEMVGNKTGIWMPGCHRLNTLKQMQSFAYWKDKKGFFSALKAVYSSQRTDSRTESAFSWTWLFINKSCCCCCWAYLCKGPEALAKFFFRCQRRFVLRGRKWSLIMTFSEQTHLSNSLVSINSAECLIKS